MQINRITVKKDGVYISARDPEEPGPFLHVSVKNLRKHIAGRPERAGSENL